MPEKGKSAAAEGSDGEIRGSKGSPILMRGMDPLKDHYNKYRTAHHKMLLRILETGVNRQTTAPSSTKTPSSELDVKVLKQS